MVVAVLETVVKERAQEEVTEIMIDVHHDPQNIVSLEKGKPSERAGRKTTGLSPRPGSGDTAAGLPGECSTPRAGFRGRKEILSEVAQCA